MAKYGRSDQSVTANSTTSKVSTIGAPIGTNALVKGDQVGRVDGANAHFGNTSPGSRASIDVAMFNNTTIGAFIPGKAVGVFGVSATEATTSSGNVAFVRITYSGSGYTANATVLVTNNNINVAAYSAPTVNAHSNTVGKIDVGNIAVPGAGFISPPTLTIAPPAATAFNANTAVTGGTGTGSNNVIALTSAAFFNSNDRVLYSVAAGNTAISPLVSGTKYIVDFANATVVSLKSSATGARLSLVPSIILESGHTLQGDTATAVSEVSAGLTSGIAHAGWNLRIEGSGGRAGRVSYETLVAMGSLGAQSAIYGTPAAVADSATDNIVFPGA